MSEWRGFKLIGLLVVLVSLGGLAYAEKQPEVVVYTALDQMFSEPILQDFEAETGIKVREVYDTEASKTVGLVNRIMAEQKNPRCDVFWNNEIVRTIMLKNEGLLASYQSPSAAVVPSVYKDADGYWTGFAARARVIIYNTNLIKEPSAVPRSINDLLLPQWKGNAAIAKPLFGTTSTHAAALFAYWGEEKAEAFFRGLKANEIAILQGNATVRDRVAEGEYAWGLTDTDDANGALEDGRPVGMIFPDQDGMGTLLIPNTLALIKNSPNPEAGKKLIDYLLTKKVESKLAHARGAQIPLIPGVDAPKKVTPAEQIKGMEISFEKVAEMLTTSVAFCQEEFGH